MQRLARTLATLLFAIAATACAQVPVKPKLTDAGVTDPHPRSG